MVSKKAWWLWGGLVTLISLMGAGPGFGQTYPPNIHYAFEQTRSYSASQTLGYVVHVAVILKDLEESLESGANPIKLFRWASASLRAIPRTGVDSEAVVLTWRTAALFDRAADVGERYQNLQGAAFKGGWVVGSMLASEDENAQAAGALLGILGLILGVNEASQIEQELQSLEVAAQKLGVAWEVYLKKLGL
jgi:hypothetical protein